MDEKRISSTIWTSLQALQRIVRWVRPKTIIGALAICVLLTVSLQTSIPQSGGASEYQTTTLYGETIDGIIHRFGYTYSNAQNGEYTDVQSGATSDFIGQRYNSTTYNIWRLYVSFDTSPIPDDATNIVAKLYLKTCSTKGSSRDFQISVFGQDGDKQPIWGSSLGAEDWGCGSIPIGSWDTANWQPETYFEFANTSLVNVEARTQFELRSNLEGTFPTDDERIPFHLADGKWESPDSRPKLVVSWDHTPPPPRLPDQPSNVAPADGSSNVSVTPTLQSSTFSDPYGGDYHAASQWQITTTPGNYSSPVFDTGTASGYLTSITLTLGILEYSTNYYWRVRHQDDWGTWSNWSTETSFRTIDYPYSIGLEILPLFINPWQMEWDGFRYIWYSGFLANNGCLVRVDTETILTDPSSAVQWWDVAPTYHGETGSSYGGASVGVAIGGGYIWSSSAYSGGDLIKTELLSRFNPSTFEVKYYWLPVEAKGIRAIRYDGAGNIWIAASRIIKFNIATETITICTEPLGVYDLLIDGSLLWATAPVPRGIIKYDMSTSTFVNYVPISHPALLCKDASGAIWFSMNQVQKIGKLIDGSITYYSIGIPDTDSPYGLCFDDSGMLWVAGYSDHSLIEFNPTTSSVIQVIETSGRPYYLIKDNACTIWGTGQNPPELYYISRPATNTPNNVSPANGATGVSLTPTLTSSAFSDPNPSDTHRASQWQIRTSTGSYSSPVYDSGTDTSNLTSITIPSGRLYPNTTYYWHLRHQDSDGAWSDYSSETSLTTVFSAPPPTPTPGVIPHQFWGDVTINGLQASEGTVISAQIGGVEYGSGTVDTAGKYGYFPNFIVLAPPLLEGQTINFYVAGVPALQTAIFHKFSADELDLSIITPGPVQAMRDLPEVAQLPGQTFDVTVTFTAPDNDFNSIGLDEKVPAGWAIQSDKTWCTPDADIANVVGDQVQYAWFGPYNSGQTFTALYRVTVPVGASLGSYIFTGQLGYKIGGGSIVFEVIAGDSTVQVSHNTPVSGIIREINGNILPGVSVTINGTGLVLSNQSGQYQVMATATGDYTVTAHKDGFRDRTITLIVVEPSPAYDVTCNFQGQYGLIPNAPDMQYALDCVNLWLYPPNQETGLDMWTALDAVNAWLYPITD